MGGIFGVSSFSRGLVFALASHIRATSLETCHMKLSLYGLWITQVVYIQMVRSVWFERDSGKASFAPPVLNQH